MLSIQTAITAEIIEALKNGVKPWVRPWQIKGTNGLPINFATGKEYSGINIAILWFESFKKDYVSNAWMTFSQIKKLNGSIVKGSKGTACVYFSLLEKADAKTGEIKKIPLYKRFTLFNMQQVLGVKYELPLDENEFNSNERAELILTSSNANILHGSTKAFYRPKTDQICLPHKNVFRTPEDYYATALHELVHWTGHEERLNRTKGKYFADSDYAFEELVAELGSAFLCGENGIQGNLQHASYIDSWLKILETDTRAIFRAASLASKAHLFIKDLSRSLTEINAA
jgi:antirestriction protein ArdC